MSKIRDFFRPQRLGFHLVLAVVVTIVLFVVVTLILKAYTRHGNEVVLPDYLGQNAEELMAADTSGFLFVVRNSVFDKGKPDGTIVGQEPRAGDKVKPGRKVFLTITNATPKKVKMPQLAGAGGLRRAQNLLEASGLVLENVIYVDSDMDAGLVIEQYHRNRPIAAGTEIEEGAKITLHVSAGKVNTDDDELNLEMEGGGNYSLDDNDIIF